MNSSNSHSHSNIDYKLLTLDILSPLDSRYASSTQDLKSILSEYGLFKYRVQVEICWLLELGKSNLENVYKFSLLQQNYLQNLYLNFSIDDAYRIKQIEAITNHDVKAVEYWIKEKIGLKLPSNIADKISSDTFDISMNGIDSDIIKCAEFIHFACTSEDINNIAHALMLKDASIVLNNKLNTIIEKLQQLANVYAGVPMLSRTHGQSASPTTMGKEIANVVHRLKYALQKVNQVELKGKMNGAVGNYNAHIIAYDNFDWHNFSKNLIENTFALHHNSHTTQIELHDYMAELFNAISRINVILLDFNRDIWGYISLGYFKQKLKSGEIGSSTMPHKVNPIDFENSEGNLGIANALLEHFAQKLPISRWQRDLTDSTVIRNIGMALGYCLLAYSACSKGIDKLEINHIAINKDLDSNWEILAEPIQTVMRKYNIPNPYEQLKELTRGKGISADSLRDFINTLAIPEIEKNKLLQLTPTTYVGIAEKLAKMC